MSDSTPNGDKLYLVLISVHGLMRGHNLELGRDADTGGQILYVVELARALAAHPDVERVDLLTRQVLDAKVDRDYAQPLEEIAPGAHIVRIPCGPRRYLRKEVLWPHLDSFTDNAIQHINRVGRTPDVIHSHYADAGYVGARLSQLLGAPLAHTGHSLGRVKRQRLLASNVREDTIESQYNMAQRIEAEEIALGNAALVVASTTQEVEEQYAQYENYHPKRMVVIPPGVDLQRFHAPSRGDTTPHIAREVGRFLHEPRKPMVLALSRPDYRKNICNLVRAYGENPDLRELANLVVVAGNRDDIQSMDKGSREVLTELLLHIDYYDLYGAVAYPKHHEPNDVPDLYRMVTRSRGVFVNPALTEPFGLTLIEAAASGAPIVATNDGGPRDIIAHCKNGVLIDPLDVDGIGQALVEAIGNRSRWLRWSKNGIRGAKQHYSWAGHVDKYLREVKKAFGKRGPRGRMVPRAKSRLPAVERILVSDLDNTLLGDGQALQALLEQLGRTDDRIGFGVATGRPLDSALKALKQWGVPRPDLLITGVGTQLHYGHGMVEDKGWLRHIDYQWKPDALREAMCDVPGIKLQPKGEQLPFKISYFVDPGRLPSVREIRRHLRRLDLHAKLIYSHDAFLDVLPVRASMGLAIRHIAWTWNIAAEALLVAGDSGNDEEMLSGNTLGVVVGNHARELEHLRGRSRVYFADGCYAWGVLEGIEHYDFFGEIRIPAEEG
ncbi:MAG: HAD-IIB family hydrolase [Gammaproteobacteria bacterium]|nr:HAD-IIB family hydrolase [Gammaproteobacteria bacterium]NIT63399.1 HAD-IIB family hydrolase [Gammaproteobacteria bacterium]NIX10206.1 HAD-IIB family hydrolase [Gammaproteobacteria bacterium]NIY31979.1 HAD-IIB family hydrolase [Gammaproteobacteria bacterium]